MRGGAYWSCAGLKGEQVSRYPFPKGSVNNMIRSKMKIESIKRNYVFSFSTGLSPLRGGWAIVVGVLNAAEVLEPYL